MPNQSKSLPAGLLNGDMEFFNDPQDHEVCYCLTAGRVTRITDLPESIKAMIRADISQNPVKAEALVELGYERDDDQLEKYCSCCFGAFDGSADVINGEFVHNEYWPCPKRGICPVEGKLCDALKVGKNGQVLTRREVDVLSLIAKGLLDKEIAADLQISEETLKVHKKHIMEKSGCQNKHELILLAFKKNLV